MSDSRQDLARLVGDLVETVEELESELGGGRPPGPPTPGDLARFTSEVTIPAIVLVLETNVRALKLLQRALRFGGDRAGTTGGDRAGERARAAGRSALARLDEAFADLGEALEGRPTDDRTRDLLEEAREVRAEIDDRLAESAATDPERPDDGTGSRVEVDVDSELQALKDDIDDGDDGPE
jgi:hypothetical protein